MAKKRGGSPASRNVMKQLRLCKETHVEKLPVLYNNVPQSVLPYISAGGSKKKKGAEEEEEELKKEDHLYQKQFKVLLISKHFLLKDLH